MTKKYENAGKKWTPELIDWLEENYTTKSLATISKTLKRSPQAIEEAIRRYFKSADRVYLDGYFTPTQIANIFGVTKVTVRNWIENLKLPARKYKGLKSTRAKDKKFFYGIEIGEFYKWLKKNKTRVNFNTGFINIDELAGCPQWLKDDVQNKVQYGVAKRWVKKEEKLLLHYIDIEKKSYEEVAEILLRSKESVSKKYTRIKSKNLTKIA